jgi:hypothetical protein
MMEEVHRRAPPKQDDGGRRHCATSERQRMEPRPLGAARRRAAFGEPSPIARRQRSTVRTGRLRAFTVGRLPLKFDC